ncbi:hypothetical protein BDV95DRAFT_598731 [Massariosphaeria phaeospora]|uniref:Uncharacterized protein n=1 Tax=Massariosphaeria phaeospora TaxID=100035 RepID=A0A7C8M5P2_9PLEO|nr:hypothetical protein BDV95DRAFT_598731 [Massariosphaeria phaeospora]
MASKRGFMSRSDEQFGDEADYGTVHRAVYTWPKESTLALPFAFSQRDAHDVITSMSAGGNVNYHLDRIRQIAVAYELAPAQVQFAYRSTGRHNSTDELYLSVLAGRRRSPEANAKTDWENALLDFRRHLKEFDVHINIEIVDSRAARGPLTFALPDKPDHTMAWEKTYIELLEILREAGGHWITMDLFLRSLDSRESARPTVCITTPDANTRLWREDLSQTLWRAAARKKFDFEFIFSNKLDCMNDSQISMGDMSGLTTLVEMGASCGVKGEKGSGSVGGLIKLSYEGKDLGDFMITNHHVLSTAAIEEACTGQHALPPQHDITRKKTHVIVSPSDTDMDIMRKFIQGHLDDLDRHLRHPSDGRPSRVDMAEMDPSKAVFLQTSLALEQLFIQRKRELEEWLPHSKRILGTLFATSGRRTMPATAKELEIYRRASDEVNPHEDFPYEADIQAPDWIMDWSLTKVQSPRILDNEVPGGLPDMKPGPDRPFLIVPGSDATVHRTFDQITTKRFAKKGRSTGWTNGVMNQVVTVVNGTILSTYGKALVRCWSVVGLDPEGQQYIHANKDLNLRTICEPGDLGSVLFWNNDAAPWVGLMFAAQSTMSVGYFTPLAHIFRDIQAVTGCTITSPTNWEGQLSGSPVQGSRA